MTTYTEALQTQLDQLLSITRRLDERGWALIVHHNNPHGGNKKHYFIGGLEPWLQAWCGNENEGRSRDRRLSPVLIDTWPTEKGVSFCCGIPNRVRFRPIHAALNLMTKRAENKWEARSASGLMAVKVSDYTQYSGNTRDELTILVTVLDMPQHRDILLGK